jgi:hypothetical protein
VLVLAVAGCGKAQSQAPKEAPAPVAAGSEHDPATIGTILGRVAWEGEVPSVPPYEVRAYIPVGGPGQPRLLTPNPNAPAVDAQTRGVAGAVVFLRGVPAAKARPWHHAPVRVEQRDRLFHILQGGTEVRVGLVHRGDEIEMDSRDKCFHALHAGGAAFFTLTFPDPDKPRKRHLSSPGLVELTSAAGYYWMRGYLFVDDHPYYAVTDAQGRFRLEQVPPGRYEIVCWLPSWQEQRHDRDPESSLVTRLFLRPPVERQQSIEVRTGTTVAADFALSTSDFSR